MMKIVSNDYVGCLSETDHGLDGYAGGLSLDGLGCELRALYDDMTRSEPPDDLIELAERVEALAAETVAKA